MIKIYLDHFHLNEKISIRVYYFRNQPYYFYLKYKKK